MRKIFAGFLMTVMMLSGCGVAKNLEDPGSTPVPNPEDYRVVCFGHHVPEVLASTFLCSVAVVFAFLVGSCLRSPAPPAEIHGDPQEGNPHGGADPLAGAADE